MTGDEVGERLPARDRPAAQGVLLKGLGEDLGPLVIIYHEGVPSEIFDFTRLAIVRLTELIDLALGVVEPLLKQSHLVLEKLDVGHGQTSRGIADRRFATPSAILHCDPSVLSASASSRKIRLVMIGVAPRFVIMVICGIMASLAAALRFPERDREGLRGTPSDWWSRGWCSPP